MNKVKISIKQNSPVFFLLLTFLISLNVSISSKQTTTLRSEFHTIHQA